MLPFPFAASDYEIGSRIGEIAGPVFFGLLTFLLIRRARRRPPGRARKTDVIVALLFGAILVAGLVRLAHHELAGPWQSPQGRNVRAGFVDGCQRSAGGQLDCGCVFVHLSSEPAYDTPDEFLSLRGPAEAFARSGDVRALPPEYVAAVQSCVATG